MRFRRLFLFAITALAATASVQAEPIRLHPDNSRYFLYKDNPTVLIGSTEHYGAVLNLDFDYIHYLNELQAKGLNLTRTFSGVYCEIPGSFDIEKNTLAPKPLRYIAPWARSSVPGYVNQGNKFDLNQFDSAYFVRLKDFVTQASQRGVVVEMVLFCTFYNDDLWKHSPMHAANNISGLEIREASDVYTLNDIELTDIQDNVTRKIVQELNEFDNVYFEICNEPYFMNVTDAWQSHISQTIVDTEAKLPKKHLIAQNIANGSKKIEKPDPNVSVFNYHYAYPPDAVAQNYDLNKVIAFDETGFVGSADAKYRQDAWAFLLAGGAVYDHLDYSFTTEREDGTDTYKAPGGGSMALRQQFQILKNFMDGLDFIQMKPVNDLGVKTDAKDVKTWILGKEGGPYALYFLGGKMTKATLKLPEASYQPQWIDPVTGHEIAVKTKGKAFEYKNGELTLTVPKYGDDVALKLTVQPEE